MYKIIFPNKEYNDKLADVQFIQGEATAEISDYDVYWFQSIGATVEKIEEPKEEVEEKEDKVKEKPDKKK